MPRNPCRHKPIVFNCEQSLQVGLWILKSRNFTHVRCLDFSSQQNETLKLRPIDCLEGSLTASIGGNSVVTQITANAYSF